MSLAGGASDKFGNFYEGLWTVKCFLDILDEQADSIRLEPPNEEGFEFWLRKLENEEEDWDGVTFKTYKDDIYEYHQVKTKSDKQWTISSLEDNKIKVLSHFKKKLNDEPSAKCVFISNSGASELNELTTRAKKSKSWQEFLSTTLNIKIWRQNFSQLCAKSNNINIEWKEINEVINLIIQTKKLSNDQQQIVQFVNESYELLKRIEVRTIDINSLREKVELQVRTLVEKIQDIISLGDKWYSNVVDILAQLVLSKSHHEFTAFDIWRHLEDQGYQRREWGKNTHVLASLEKCNNSYINSVRYLSNFNSTIKIIKREEAKKVIDLINNDNNNCSILLFGEAGIGKSGVLFQIIEEVQTQNIPFLVFRIDDKIPTQNGDFLGKELGLPASPEIVIANIAKSHKKQGILIIDQLDAVSLASGRNPDFFNCIINIIEKAKTLKLNLILACRKFDLDNDYRLKNLLKKDSNSGEQANIAEEIIINPLTDNKVKEVVKNLGLNANALNQKQIKLLAIPLHLQLLAEIVVTSKEIENLINTLNFETANDLFDQYWIYKQRNINKRLNCPIRWIEVIDKLCDYMSKQQTLSAPQSIIDEYLRDVDVMVSECTLVREGKRIRFFHESFFDYAFARRFVGREKELLSFLREDEQHLFKRVQVRQILLHQRDENFEQYINDLIELLNSSDIRFHIKQLVLDLLSNIDEPKEEEWNILSPLIQESDNPLNEKVWIMLRQSTAWFKLLDSFGIIEEWLKEENEQQDINNTIILISIMQRQIPERVTELLKPFVSKSNTEIWHNRFLYIIHYADIHINRRFFELFLQLIDRGIFDHLQEQEKIDQGFWFLLCSLPEKQPDWACEAIGKYLNRCLDLYEGFLANNQSLVSNINPFFRINYRICGDNPIKIANITTIHNTKYSEIFFKTVEKSPKYFLKIIFPFIIKVINLTLDKQNNPPWRDHVWKYREYKNYDSFTISPDIDKILLNTIEKSLQYLAKNEPEYLVQYIENQELIIFDFETIQYLLIRGYTANGKFFADKAVEYLCENSARLKTGYDICNGNVHAAPFWATRELLFAITPHCSEENLTKLQQLILNYYPNCERHKNYKYSRGYAQFVLLDAIDSSRRNSQVSQKIQEWRRKFVSNGLFPQKGDLEKTGKIQSPKSIQGYFAGSPIPQNATEKMTDEQWLKAIQKYNDDNDVGNRFDKTGNLIGGTWQLASELHKEVKKDPYRFAQLIQQFPNNANIAYFDAVLRGVAETEVEIDVLTVFSVCQCCHQLPKKPCGKSISWIYHKFAHLSWQPKHFDIIIYYALNDPDPSQELWQVKVNENSDDFYYRGKPYDAGINSTRGSAVGAISRLIFADKTRTKYFTKDLGNNDLVIYKLFFYLLFNDIQLWLEFYFTFYVSPLGKIVDDSSIAVRSCVAEVLIALLNYDRDLAVELFLRLCDIQEDKLLGTPNIDHFLYYALQTHFEQLKPILERMINSEILEVQEIGTKRIFTFTISTINQNAEKLAQTCLSKTKVHRKTAAFVYASNLHLAEHKELCENALIKLFDDTDEEVRSQASRCFVNINKNQQNINNYINLIRHFINSKAFEKNYNELLYLVKNNPLIDISADTEIKKLPFDISYELCQKYIAMIESSYINRENYFNQEINQILINIYTTNTEFKNKCLDLIDKMFQLNTYGIEKVMQEYDR
ncbi:hypothetical protein H6G11_09565 [Cyanobacterium aponinum FACHB-4101]|uniref:NACHT domain-containing protein n=1 Tax=Cyanobacterium aponinum TaxID=379064 RepID=UPI00168059E3|nr:hypothetical protein [Cyanobacterium aponinum]MBD2394499.1 hypothetical protein [Cyanobacterium aponinum FACHB-4101]